MNPTPCSSTPVPSLPMVRVRRAACLRHRLPAGVYLYLTCRFLPSLWRVHPSLCRLLPSIYLSASVPSGCFASASVLFCMCTDWLAPRLTDGGVRCANPGDVVCYTPPLRDVILNCGARVASFLRGAWRASWLSSFPPLPVPPLSHRLALYARAVLLPLQPCRASSQVCYR